MKMVREFKSLPLNGRWNLLVTAARRAAGENGYALSRLPGRGLSNVWHISKNGDTKVASIRTTQDRWIAFPPLQGGKEWKTLSDVDAVIVAAVDSKEAPRKVQVYLLPAEEVRKRFDASYAARMREGHKVRDNFGMWVALDPVSSGAASAVGSGIARAHKPIATYELADLMPELEESGELGDGFEPHDEERTTETASPEGAPALKTIADVIGWARSRIAEIAGVKAEAVKLDLKLEI